MSTNYTRYIYTSQTIPVPASASIPKSPSTSKHPNKRIPYPSAQSLSLRMENPGRRCNTPSSSPQDSTGVVKTFSTRYCNSYSYSSQAGIHSFIRQLLYYQSTCETQSNRSHSALSTPKSGVFLIRPHCSRHPGYFYRSRFMQLLLVQRRGTLYSAHQKN
jgi:hypothetical protein